ncbi:MAG: glutamate--cysteine ligase [Methylophilaceae bacterium]
MIPKLNNQLSEELFKLENYIINHSCDVEHWFRSQWSHQKVPFYSSVDLRNSGFKLAPVDTNLFPGGFNNLCETFIPLSIQATTVAIEKVCPEARKLIIIPENHTRNEYYLENLYHLHNILERSGLNVCFGSFNPEINQPQQFSFGEKKLIKIYPLIKDDRFLKIKLEDGSIFRPCAVLLNNDLSAGVPEILKDIEQTIIPSINASWKTRRKSSHFKFYDSVAEEFAEFVNCDPWLINSYFTSQKEINFHKRIGEEALVTNVSNILEKIKKKYLQYQIKHEPYVVIKADAGTYGMGIMIAKNADDVKNLNRKKRNKMSVIKDGNEVTEVIIQEGIHSEETINGAVTEPVVYTIDQFVIGGFYRVHTNKEKDENLNSPGMHFIPQPFETSCLMPDQGRPCDDEANRFYAYGVIARLALLAASREMRDEN